MSTSVYSINLNIFHYCRDLTTFKNNQQYRLLLKIYESVDFGTAEAVVLVCLITLGGAAVV